MGGLALVVLNAPVGSRRDQQRHTARLLRLPGIMQGRPAVPRLRVQLRVVLDLSFLMYIHQKFFIYIKNPIIVQNNYQLLDDVVAPAKRPVIASNPSGNCWRIACV